MQSYSRIIDADLDIEDLSNLGNRLALPEGWTFSTRILQEDYYLVSDGKAFVIQDDLAKTYQRHRNRTYSLSKSMDSYLLVQHHAKNPVFECDLRKNESIENIRYIELIQILNYNLARNLSMV